MPTVLITGASRGLGKELALAFSQGGYNLILNARNKTRLEKVAYDIKTDCIICPGDLRREDTLISLQALAQERGVNTLVNNAGVYWQGDFKDMPEAKLRELMEINFMAPILLTHRVYPLMAEKGEGTIVNINSIAGQQPNPFETAYNAGKYGLRGFTDSLRLKAESQGVRVIGFYPGTMNTKMVAGRLSPDKCMAPEKVAKMIFKICTDPDLEHITESTFHVKGELS